MNEQTKFDSKRTGALSATLRVIARDGLEKTTIRSIAKEAGCSAGSLAHYFRDKEDILRQALELADARISKRMADIIVPASEGINVVALEMCVSRLREIINFCQ